MAKKQDEPEGIKNYKENIRNKSIRQIVKEVHENVDKEPLSEASVVEEKAEEQKEELPKAEIKLEDKTTEELEAAKKTAEEAKKASDELREEINKIKESTTKTEAEKKEEIKELKANWTGFDQKGNPTPRDYDEIINEGLRLNKEQTMAFFKEQFESFKNELKTESEAEKAAKEKEEKEYQDRLKSVNDSIENELEELYSVGKLTKPKDVNDANDPAAVEVKDLFDQAAAYNLEQTKQGKPLETSIAKFYFMHYKPKAKQPAGSDAPVIGSKGTPPSEPERLNYYRDIRNQSFKQILYNAKRKLTGK